MTVRHLLLLALPACIVGCSNSPPAEQDQARVLPVETMTVREVSSYAEQRHYAGTITARRTSQLAFQRTGQVLEILVDDGDDVVAEQPIARLDTRALLQQKARIEANRLQAIAVLRELDSGPRQERIDSARATLSDLASQVTLARKSLARIRTQQSQGASSAQRLDEAQATLESFASRRDAAQRQLDELVNGTRQERKDAQAATIAQLDASLGELTVQLDDSVIKAPFAGRISRRLIDPGATVMPGQTIVTLVETQHLEARIGLPADVAKTLDASEAFTFTWRGAPVSGQLKTVLPEVEVATRNQMVVFDLEASGGVQPVPGDVVRLQVSEPIKAAGFWVPLDALSRGTRGLWSVLVAKDQDGNATVVTRAAVTVIYTEGDRVLVRGTLSDGDQIIASGSHRVVPGQLVQPTASESRMAAETKP